MQMKVYAIQSGRDELLGIATNYKTFLTLIQQAEDKKASGVSIHGEMICGETISGEYSFSEAVEILGRSCKNSFNSRKK